MFELQFNDLFSITGFRLPVLQFQELIFSYRFSITAGNIQELHFQFWGIDNVIRLTRIVQFSTALEFVQVVSKQLRNLAVPTWMDDVPQGHFRVWVFVGDDGPDVSAGVRVINTLCEDSKNKAVLRLVCFMHSLQNCCKKAVANLDSDAPAPKYSTQMMRIGNVWRSFGHHKKIRAAIEEMYDSPTAKLHATTCIAKVVRTRWATFEGPERKLLRGTFGVAPSFAENSDSVPPMRRALADCRRVARRPSEAMRSPIQDVQPSAVEGEMPSQTIVPITDDARPIQWEAVFTKALRTNSRVRDVLAVLEIDADNLQEILRARAKLSVADLASSSFWVKVLVAHVSRSPLSHGFFFLQKRKKARGAYLQEVPNLLLRLVREFADLLSDSALNDEWVWGKVFTIKAALSQEQDLVMSREDIVRLIRQSVLGNVTDFIRRFRSWGLGCEREFPWALLELVGSPLAEESESRAGFARGLAISLHSGTLPADGFSDKFVGWFRTDLAAGNIPAAAYDLLDFIATEVDGDVQGIESFNSVLRVMTQRAPCILRDLVSSRHVIRNSDAHLVSEASYTESLRREAHAVANVRTEHERLQPPPILDASLPPVRVCVRWLPCKRNTIVRLAQDVKAFVRLWDIVIITVRWQQCGDMRWPWCGSFQVGPWCATSNHRKGLHGILCDISDATWRLPDRERMAESYSSLMDVVADCLAGAPWPLPQGSKAQVRIADVTWSTRNISEFRTVGEVKLPYSFSRGVSSCAVSEVHAEGHVEGYTHEEGFDLELMLEELMNNQDLFENSDEDAPPEADDIRRSKIRKSIGRAASTLAPDVELENPLLSPDEIIDEALEVAAAAEQTGDEVNDPMAVEGNVVCSSSSSASSSSSSCSSSNASADKGEGIDSIARGPGRAPMRCWEPLHCKRCGSVCGRIKYYTKENAKLPHYEMSIIDREGAFAQVSKHQCRRACRHWAKNWVRANRCCCE